MFNRVFNCGFPSFLMSSITSRIVAKLLFRFRRSLGFALQRASLVSMLSRSATYLSFSLILFNSCVFFKNSSVISSLLVIFSLSLSGFTIASFKNLFPIGVLVLSRTQKSVPIVDDLVPILYIRSRFLIVASSSSRKSLKLSELMLFKCSRLDCWFVLRYSNRRVLDFIARGLFSIQNPSRFFTQK